MTTEPSDWDECFYKSGPRNLPGRPFRQARTRWKSAAGRIPRPAVLACWPWTPRYQNCGAHVSVVRELSSPRRLVAAAGTD